ncbi:hypothetical protein [Streptomyces sp. NPDC047071]|uniref:hypothetical protein n=1 Tax=Streptomyces sp. NPDC047071 TaxID=3154808 RepID=UPI003452138D
MHASLRRATRTLAEAAAEGLDMASALAGGGLGAWAGYTNSPESWSGDWRLAFAGGFAVVAAAAVNSLAELFLKPLRRLLGRARSTTRSRGGGHTAPGAPATLDEGLAQVVAGTEDDAAVRAASAAWRVDQGENFLRDVDRWRGYEDGEASFYLAPGVWLHYRSEKDRYGNAEPRFTLLTGDGDQAVAISGMEQIRHHLAARAAGLSVAPACHGEEITDGAGQLKSANA